MLLAQAHTLQSAPAGPCFICIGTVWFVMPSLTQVRAAAGDPARVLVDYCWASSSCTAVAAARLTNMVS